MSALMCRDCGQTIAQQEEKALSGEVQVVWADWEGQWTCPITGDEHEPGEPRHSVEVTVKFGDRESMIRLTPAEMSIFVFAPIFEAMDDSEMSHFLAEDDPERFATIERWATDLWKVTGDKR